MEYYKINTEELLKAIKDSECFGKNEEVTFYYPEEIRNSILKAIAQGKIVSKELNEKT